MCEFNLSYREVIPDQTITEASKEINLNTGGTQSTLQDIKVAERAGGFCYKNSSKHTTRNRFISWRINHDLLELIEQSLDVNLTGNKVKYKFLDTPILDGISIHETHDNVIILVPTVCSIHRLVFQHPNILHRQEELRDSHPDLALPSIFADVNVSHARDPSSFHVFNSPTSASSQLPHAATSILTPGDLEAIFIFAYPSGELLLVKQAANGQSFSVELKYESIVPRFLSGIADKFRSKHSDADVVVSMLLHMVGLEVYALTLSHDGHLRVWSCSKCQCIAVTDVLAETADNGRRLLQSAHNHVLRTALDNNETDFILTVFMCFASESQFHVFKPTISGTQFSMIRINTLYSPGIDLVDFNLTSSRIWSLWRNEEGECNLYTAVLNNNGSEGTHWIPVLLEPTPDSNYVPDSADTDPRQAYLQLIFYPGRFPLHIISKALSIYKRSPILSEVNLSPSVLKQRVSMAVENEIQNELKESEVIDEDYLECASWCWSRFYSCCVQYYVAGLKPLGLLLLPSVSGVVLLKKSMYSFLRPLDSLEHLMLCSEYATVEQFIEHPLLSEDLNITEYVINLMEVIVYLEQQLSEDFKTTFEKELCRLRSPDVIISELITEILTEMDEQFTWTISQKLNECKDIYQAMHKLLELIRLDSNFTESNENSEQLCMSVKHMFSSVLGISLAARCIHQQSVVRFAVCRNLLVIQNILSERGEHEWNTLEAVRSVCLPEIVVLTQASYTTLYMTELPALSVIALECTTQALAPLKLTPVFNLKTNQMHSVSLLELFVQSSGGFEAHKRFSEQELDEETLPHWHTSLLPYVAHLSRLLWPVSGNALFAEWLLSSGQGVWLQQYVRLLNNWCEWNNCTRNFLLAASLLSTGEHYKALHLFLESMKGIFSDQFLADRILPSVSEEDAKNRAYVQYFLKVIQLFELHGARDCAIKVAVTAITIADGEDCHLATLYSLKFIHHLALGHYDEAYNAINANPDKDRKKDNLRDLVKVLLESNKLDVLISFPFVDMQKDLQEILFARARASDCIDNIFYDFLYAYQIKLGPRYFRVAAGVMYEQAYRLQQWNTLDCLEKQVKCYLATINTLQLLEDPLHAFVIRPIDEEPKKIKAPIKETGEFVDIEFKREIEIAELADLKKEYKMASAKLRFVQFVPHFSVSPSIGVQELVVLMANVGLFKPALSLCNSFSLSYEPVFEILIKQCLTLDFTESTKAWNWLVENDLHDLKVIGNTPSNAAWNLLFSLLDEYEEENATVLHKVVCLKIIKMSRFIPQCLLTTYKRRNCGELIRILYKFGRLHEAVDLAIEYLKGALGYGKELFGFVAAVGPSSPQFCIPINLFEHLIYELKMQNKEVPEKPFVQEYQELHDVYVRYLETCSRTSKEKRRLLMSQSN